MTVLALLCSVFAASLYADQILLKDLYAEKRSFIMYHKDITPNDDILFKRQASTCDILDEKDPDKIKFDPTAEGTFDPKKQTKFDPSGRTQEIFDTPYYSTRLKMADAGLGAAVGGFFIYQSLKQAGDKINKACAGKESPDAIKLCNNMIAGTTFDLMAGFGCFALVQGVVNTAVTATVPEVAPYLLSTVGQTALGYAIQPVAEMCTALANMAVEAVDETINDFVPVVNEVKTDIKCGTYRSAMFGVAKLAGMAFIAPKMFAWNFVTDLYKAALTEIEEAQTDAKLTESSVTVTIDPIFEDFLSKEGHSELMLVIDCEDTQTVAGWVGDKLFGDDGLSGAFNAFFSSKIEPKDPTISGVSQATYDAITLCDLTNKVVTDKPKRRKITPGQMVYTLTAPACPDSDALAFTVRASHPDHEDEWNTIVSKSTKSAAKSASSRFVDYRSHTEKITLSGGTDFKLFCLWKDTDKAPTDGSVPKDGDCSSDTHEIIAVAYKPKSIWISPSAAVVVKIWMAYESIFDRATVRNVHRFPKTDQDISKENYVGFNYLKSHDSWFGSPFDDFGGPIGGSDNGKQLFYATTRFEPNTPAGYFTTDANEKFEIPIQPIDNSNDDILIPAGGKILNENEKEVHLTGAMLMKGFNRGIKVGSTQFKPDPSKQDNSSIYETIAVTFDLSQDIGRFDLNHPIPPHNDTCVGH